MSRDPFEGLRAKDYWKGPAQISEDVMQKAARFIMLRLEETRTDGEGRRSASATITKHELINELGVPEHLFALFFTKLSTDLGYTVLPRNSVGWDFCPGQEFSYITVLTTEPEA